MNDKRNPLAPYEGQFDVQTRKQMVAGMIGELRKAKGFPQKEVAEILGISPQTYNGYERGRNEPPIEILVRLSFLYQMPLDALVQRDIMETPAETVRRYEEELAQIRCQLAESPLATNEQLQALLNSMEHLTGLSKAVIEKQKP